MKFDDSLWKAILEDLFADFLRFFFSNADTIFDMKKGFEYLDKEMAQIAIESDLESPKYVDKLVKAYTHTGNEQWVLVHVEVQGYTDLHFEERMFSYYYRIFDRYRKRITAIVLLTDRDRKFHPAAYHSEFLGTEIRYRFNTYKVLDQSEDELQKSSNPFAFVILTALLALQRGRLTDKALLDLKLVLARNLLERNFSKSTIKGIFNFIRYYVAFANPENDSKFDNKIDSFTQKSRHMGIIETIKERETQKILERGIEKGKAEGRIESKTEVVRNLITKLGLPDVQAAEIAEVPVAFVKKIRASLKKKK
jgi:predicted transposase YdaD